MATALDTLLTFVILVGFALLVYSKAKKQTMIETIKKIIESIKDIGGG